MEAAPRASVQFLCADQLLPTQPRLSRALSLQMLVSYKIWQLPEAELSYYCSHLRLHTSLSLLAPRLRFPGNSPYFLPCVNCTKRNKGLNEAKQCFTDSQKIDTDCTQPWKTSFKIPEKQTRELILLHK